MIRKNTKIFFDDNGGDGDELAGGMPLSKGDMVHVHRGEQVVDYEVIDKIIDCFMGGEDQVINITYWLKKI